MRKLFILFMILAMMPIVVLAADKTLFSVTSSEGSKGDEVSVYVKMKNNDKFGMLGIKLTYDEDVLSYEDGSFVNLEEAFMKGIEENNGVITIYALALDNSIVVKDSLAKLDFKIKDDSKEKVEIDVNVTDYGKDEVTPLQYEVKKGEIVINSKKVNNDKNSSNDKNGSKNDKSDKKNDSDKKQDNDSDDKNVTEDKEDNEDNPEDKEIEENEEDSKKEIDSKESKNKIIYILMGIVCIIGAIGSIVVFRKKK